MYNFKNITSFNLKLYILYPRKAVFNPMREITILIFFSRITTLKLNFSVSVIPSGLSVTLMRFS